MSNPQDQPAREQGRGVTAAGNTMATENTAAAQGTGTARGADATRQYVPRPAPGYDDVSGAAGRPGGAVGGLTLMAAVLMMLSGIWGFLEGLAAVIRGSFFVVLPHYAYSVSITGWGWIHLILGVVVFATGMAILLKDALWARILGVVLVSFSAIANFVFIPYQPVWSIVLIAIDLAVIWALLSPRREWA
jgi:vacuolar-type H+-ATPase subunit I/STV1